MSFWFRYKWCYYQPSSPRDPSRHQCHQRSSTHHWSRAHPIQISFLRNLGKEVVSWTNVIWTKFHIHCIITLYICKYSSPILFVLNVIVLQKYVINAWNKKWFVLSKTKRIADYCTFIYTQASSNRSMTSGM